MVSVALSAISYTKLALDPAALQLNVVATKKFNCNLHNSQFKRNDSAKLAFAKNLQSTKWLIKCTIFFLLSVIFQQQLLYCVMQNQSSAHIKLTFPSTFFPLFGPKWLSNMKGKVEWARDSSLNVIGKTLWAKVLWTLRCSTLSSSTIIFILQWQKGQSHFLFFSETLIFGSFGRGFRCKWRIQSLVELSQGLKKSWIKGIAEVAREVDWNLTGKTLCLRVLCICKCSFFSLLILTLQYGHNSIVLSNQSLTYPQVNYWCDIRGLWYNKNWSSFFSLCALSCLQLLEGCVGEEYLSPGTPDK